MRMMNEYFFLLVLWKLGIVFRGWNSSHWQWSIAIERPPMNVLYIVTNLYSWVIAMLTANIVLRISFRAPISNVVPAISDANGMTALLSSHSKAWLNMKMLSMSYWLEQRVKLLNSLVKHPSHLSIFIHNQCHIHYKIWKPSQFNSLTYYWLTNNTATGCVNDPYKTAKGIC